MQKIGEFLGVSAVFFGTVTVEGAVSSYVVVKLMDIKSGRIIVESHRPDGLLMPLNPSQCTSVATERVAKDMLKALVDLKLKKQILLEK